MTATAKITRPATVTLPADREIRTERVFDAPRDRVWRAMTEPDLLAQWWGRGNKLVIERYEFRKGGQWRFVEHAPDGVTGFEGKFLEIAPPGRLSMTFEWDGAKGHGLTENISLVDLGDGRTRVETLSQFKAKEDRDGMVAAGMEGGLNESYAALDRLLATLR